MRQRLGFLILLLLLVSGSSNATLLSRSVVFDLEGLSFGTLPTDAFTTSTESFTPATITGGDQLELTIDFANGDMLQATDNGSFFEFFGFILGPSGTPNGTFNATFDFLGVSGDLLTNNFTLSYTGNWVPFTSTAVNLTDTSFAFSGVRLTVDALSVNSPGSNTFSEVTLDAQGFNFDLSDADNNIPLPTPLSLFAFGLVLIGSLKRGILKNWRN
jgi:hypothetical protein